MPDVTELPKVFPEVLRRGRAPVAIRRRRAPEFFEGAMRLRIDRRFAPGTSWAPCAQDTERNRGRLPGKMRQHPCRVFLPRCSGVIGVPLPCLYNANYDVLAHHNMGALCKTWEGTEIAEQIPVYGTAGGTPEVVECPELWSSFRAPCARISKAPCA